MFFLSKSNFLALISAQSISYSESTPEKKGREQDQQTFSLWIFYIVQIRKNSTIGLPKFKKLLSEDQMIEGIRCNSLGLKDCITLFLASAMNNLGIFFFFSQLLLFL